MKNKRHLAAILFTELQLPRTADAELSLLRRGFHQVLQAEHKNFNGRIVNFFGNGSVSLFRCTLDAVQCALAMQQKFHSVPHLQVRIGLHVGEVLNEKDDVSGASVNLAARILALGIPGSILLSDIVYMQIRNQPELDAIPLGRFPMKNISGKVFTYALKETGIVVPSRNEILRARRRDLLQPLLRSPLQLILGLGRLVATVT